MDVRACSTVGVPLPRSVRRARNSAASDSAHGRSINRSVSRWNDIVSYVAMPPPCPTGHRPPRAAPDPGPRGPGPPGMSRSAGMFTWVRGEPPAPYAPGEMKNMRVEIWSDIACPWCYVGKARFEKALSRLPAP